MFLIAGSAITVAMVVLLAGSSFMTREVVFETYLDESVQGLDVGSPVKLRGVKIGTVSEIGFVRDYYETDSEERLQAEGNAVVVRMLVAQRREDPEYSLYDDDDQTNAFLERAIKDGLRLQVASAGLTGISFMQADYLDPGRFPPMEIDWVPEHYYVPSAPSTFKTISTAAERIIARVENVDFESLVSNFDDLLVTVESKVAVVDIEAIQDEAIGLLAGLRKTNERIQGELGDGAGSTLGKVELAVEELQVLLVSLRRSVDTAAYDLTSTLSNLRAVSEDLRDVSANARAYPSSILFGEAPPRVDREKGR